MPNIIPNYVYNREISGSFVAYSLFCDGFVLPMQFALIHHFTFV